MYIHKTLRRIFNKLSRRQKYSLYDLDLKLDKILNKRNGFYIELGANDGLSQSNSLFFERYRGFTGILIEPAPSNYLACVRNRSPKNKIFCNACVSSEYQEKYVDLEYADLMSVSVNLKLDLPDIEKHLLEGSNFMKRSERKYKFGAIARTLSDIIYEADAPKCIDFLSLDVEGAELEVLRGIDFSAHRINYILVEARNIEAVGKFLHTKGYEIVEKLSPHDYLFKLSNFFGKTL